MTTTMDSETASAWDWIDSAGEWQEALRDEGYVAAARANALEHDVHDVTETGLIQAIEWARGQGRKTTMTARARMTVPETDHSIEEAATHLYAAVIQSLPSDDQIIMDHVREALGLLDPAALARAERIRAEADARLDAVRRAT